MNEERLLRGIGLMQEALRALSGGPFDYTLKCLLAAREALLTRYAPFKVGDRVCLRYTPEINEKTAPGWCASTHFLVAGACGTVRSSDVTSDGRLIFDVEFDDETWIDRGGVRRPVDTKHTYCFGEQALMLEGGLKPMTSMQPTDAWPLTEEAKELLPANPFSAQPKRPNESGSTLCEVRWLVETPAGWLGAYDIEAFEAYKHMMHADGGGLTECDMHDDESN